ncbi:MAG: hypothetical protein HY927_01055 [Elusimicrobia bacterium]|nr:hypothetical protein [Elusimicrobiota bacterium]
MNAFIALLLAAHCFAAQDRRIRADLAYTASLADFEGGRFEEALEGFMDVLLEAPGHPGAREQLRKTAEELDRREREKALAEKEALLKELQEPGAARKDSDRSAEVLAWKDRIGKIASMIRDPSRARAGFEAYAKALADIPISFRAMQPLANAKVELQKTLLEFHPRLADEPRWKGRWPGTYPTGPLAEAAMIERYHAEVWGEDKKTAQSPPTARPQIARPPRGGASSGGASDLISQMENPKVLAGIRTLAATIKDLEKRKEELLWTAVQALNAFKKDDYADSIRLWKKVLEADPGNAEARFYLSGAEDLAKLPPPAPPRPAPSPEPVSVTVPVPRTQGAEAVDIPWPDELRGGDKKAPAAAKAPGREQAREADVGRLFEEADESARRARKPPVSPPGEAPADASKPAVISPAAQALYLKGVRAYSAGGTADAVALWKACLQSDPGHRKAKRALERVSKEKP